ncbi:MAG: thiamine pyrophosphate-dependent enzyme [Candidatus Bathyarchaeia archaeon]
MREKPCGLSSVQFSYGGITLTHRQEPTAAGVIIHLHKEDAMFGSHRSMHLAIANGVNMRRLVAETLGGKTGTNKGKGGHMHWFDPIVNFWRVPIVGAVWPHAGAALAFKMKG